MKTIGYLAAVAALIAALMLVTGCGPKTTSPPLSAGAASQNALIGSGSAPEATPVAETMKPETGKPAGAGGKVKVIGYINVSSGCQAETVNLLNNLGMDYRDLVDLEIVDFGSPEGQERWSNDGLDCMTLLFDGSPALKFPGKDGQEKTVVFFMPAGFSWTHDDLTEAFAALKAGKLQILTEDEAKKELEPQPASLKASVHENKQGAELQVNGVPVLLVKTEAGGKPAAQRAQDAAAALDKWASEPVHPSHLSVAAKGDAEPVILANGAKVVTVTAGDAKAAGIQGPRQLANEWLKALKKQTVAAMSKHQ